MLTYCPILFPFHTWLAAGIFAASLPPFLFAWVRSGGRSSRGVLLWTVAVLVLCVGLVGMDLLRYWQLQRHDPSLDGWQYRLWPAPGRSMIQWWAGLFLKMVAVTFHASLFLTLAAIVIRLLASRSQYR